MESISYSPILVKKYFKEWRFVKLTKKEITKVIADKYTDFTQKEIVETLGVNRLKIHRLLHEL